MTFGDLRSLLHQPPSPEAWSALCAAFDALDPRDHEPAATYAAQLLHAWPDPLRALPERHIQGFVTDRLHPLYPLCRALRLSYSPRATLHALTSSANLAPITHLTLESLPVAPNGDDSLLPAILHRTRLRQLALHRSAFGTSAARAIAHAASLDQLHSLTLDALRLGPDAARALATCALPALTSLAILDQPLGRSGVNALMRWPALSQLSALTLSRIGLEAEPIPTRYDALRSLDLSHNLLGRAGLLRWHDTGALSALSTLRLADCSINEEVLRVLLDTLPPTLSSLDLSHNYLYDAGAQRLLDSKLPASLHLIAHSCRLSTDAQHLLALRFPRAQVTLLDHTPG